MVGEGEGGIVGRGKMALSLRRSIVAMPSAVKEVMSSNRQF